jgi:hypothetical protein
MVAETQQPAPPQTPTSNRWSRSNMPPPRTPGSRNGGARTGTFTPRTADRSGGTPSGRSARTADRNGGTPSGRSARTAARGSFTNGSPRPQGRVNVQIAPRNEEADLSADVIALLHSANIELSGSVAFQLRHIIRTREKMYEAEISSYIETVEGLSNELARIEGGGS